MPRYNHISTEADELRGLDVERRRPSRGATVEGDLVVPLGQSLTTAILCGAVAGLVAWLLGMPGAWRFGAIVGALALVLVWVVLLMQSRSMLWEIERVTGRDFDGDDRVGPPVELPSLRVEVVEDEDHWRIGHLPLPGGDPDRLQVLARGLLAGRPFSEGEWCGSGRPLSQRQFRSIRDAMVDAGLARWRDPDEPRQGAELTSAGRAVLRRIGEGADPALLGRADD